MANFNSLPKAIRKRIYELHLTQEEPISFKRYTELVGVDRCCRWGPRTMPALLQVSRKIKKEAAPFLYARNDFEFNIIAEITDFTYLSWPRHRHLIRRFTVPWRYRDKAASECFRSLATMRNLEELYIRVDERHMLSYLLTGSFHQILGRDPHSTQQRDLSMLQHPGIAGLLKLRIPQVQFIKLADADTTGGPIPGGVLETIVAPKIMGSKTHKEIMPKSENSFFSLSPELRNRIYDLLLRFDGPLSPSPNESTSASRVRRALKISRPASVLSILAVNRQIHDEAVGIFYHHNSFVFHQILHLHGFILRLGSLRRSMITDITVHYEDFQRDGISLIDLTFDLLKSLTGLRKLEIIMSYQLITWHDWGRYASKPKLLEKANPCLLPGMKLLFELRGITNINVRDDGVTHIYEWYTPQEWKQFTPHQYFGSAEKLLRVMNHFNTALQQAQSGRINRALLEDKRWQMRDKFPELENDEVVTTDD